MSYLFLKKSFFFVVALSVIILLQRKPTAFTVPPRIACTVPPRNRKEEAPLQHLERRQI